LSRSSYHRAHQRAGVVSHFTYQDTVGPHGRTVADAAAASVSPRAEPSTDGIRRGGVPLGWQGRGKSRPANIPNDSPIREPERPAGRGAGPFTRQGLKRIRSVRPHARTGHGRHRGLQELTNGAHLVDLERSGTTSPEAREFLVLCFDFRNDVAKVLATRVGVPWPVALYKAHRLQQRPCGRGNAVFNQDISTCAIAGAGPTIRQPASADDLQPGTGGRPALHL